MKADPKYAPEHLAAEAVRRIGPEAARWAADNPGPGAAALAIRRFTTHARISGAVSGVPGLPGAVLDAGILAWTQARMVLYVAAANGHDTTTPERATELLTLQRVHKKAGTARTALGVAAGRDRASRLLGTIPGRSHPDVLVKLGVRLARMAGIRAAKRLYTKLVPGAGLALGTWINAAATRDLATRAQTLYRPATQP